MSSKSALYAGLAGGFKSISDQVAASKQAERDDALMEAELMRKKRLAKYQNDLASDLLQKESDIELGLLRSQVKEGLIELPGDASAPPEDEWSTIMRKDQVGNERAFLYNKRTGETRDPFDTEGNLPDPNAGPEPLRWQSVVDTAKETYGIDLSGDEIAMAMVANGDEEGLEARAQMLKNQQNEPPPPDPDRDAAVEVANRELQAALGEPAKPAFKVDFKGMMRSVSDDLRAGKVNNVLAEVLKNLKGNKAPTDSQLQMLAELDPERLRSSGLPAPIIQAVEALRQ